MILLQLLSIFFLSSLVHEFGHYVAGKIIGLQVAQFQIWGGYKIFRFKSFSMGCIPLISWIVFSYNGYIPTRREKFFLITGGCIAQLLLSVIIFLLPWHWHYLNGLSAFMLLMVAVNLFPFKNSDGYHLLRWIMS